MPFTSADPSTHRQCFNVTITDDDILEETEYFSLNLTVAGDPSTPVVINPDNSIVEITDDDRKTNSYLLYEDMI